MTKLELDPGRVYRTRDFSATDRNSARKAKALVEIGLLKKVGPGLYLHPKPSRFGPVPASENELMRAFLADSPFIFTGPSRWNSLRLGTTGVEAVSLVYNTKRSGRFELGGRSFLLKRVLFPLEPSPEWYVVDLLENCKEASADPESVLQALKMALPFGRFSRVKLSEMAGRYGSKRTCLALAKILAAQA